MATRPLPADDPVVQAAADRARRLLRRRAFAGAAASVVPVPGLDWVVDAALLSKMIPAISAEFGLTAEQIAQMPQRKRDQVEQAVGVVGSMVIGKFITKDLVIRASAAVGRRLTVKRAARFVPLAGQLVSALISYGAIRYLGEQHIRDCVEVCRRARLRPPVPALPAPGSASG
ncbi:hypothetical protein H8N03_20425 [Ramlibacter sp. USB13]|uniref:DUF697 domain-containing protein n=1 Tax=Ramlibacter cellulosilyticus TaxID=2764187 RepID=A0A923MUC6_9BURK|nr:hypothetical protein [Ramlibacter cellulosilyticus]MBC5785325.1 hypothetical protein [Ramlibacter cellulosilyticus]